MKNIITTLVILLNSNILFAQNLWQVFTKSNSGICSDTVTSIYIDNNSNFWFGTAEGASKFDGNSWANYTNSNSPLQNGYHIFSIAQKNNEFYFGGWQGLIEFNGISWNVFPSLQNYHVTSLEKDANGNIWIGTQNAGIYKYDGANLTNYNPSNSPLPSYDVEDIKKDKNGNIWFAMVNYYYPNPAGIAKFDGSSWQIFNMTNSKLTNENIHSITEDKIGNLWFGADSLLLYKFDGTNWFRYDLSDQITSNWISCLSADSHGNIWGGLGYYSSERGLIKFDGKNVTRYGIAEGFPSDWAGF